MARFIIVVTFAFSLVFQASGKTNISSDLSFDCTNNNTMKIFVSRPGLYGSIYATGDKGTKCFVENHLVNGSTFFEIQKCDINETIRVIIMHLIQTGSPDDVVIGGENVSFIDLKCNEVPLGGYVINKTATFNESATTNYTLYTESPLDLDMDIKDNSHNSLKKTAIVGTMLYLAISGNDEFEFRAETCIASDSEHRHHKTLLENGLSVEQYILSNFSDAVVSPNGSPGSQHKHSLEATLYAFHFADSHYVEIMCTITVCQKDDNCPFTTKSPVPTISPTGRRKRREALGLSQTQTLRTTFKVDDQFEDNSGNVGKSGALRTTYEIPATHNAKGRCDDGTLMKETTNINSVFSKEKCSVCH